MRRVRGGQVGGESETGHGQDQTITRKSEDGMGHQDARWVGNAIQAKSGRERDRGDSIHSGECVREAG